MEGMEYDFVDTPSQDYYCPVSLKLLTDPVQTSFCCGNHLSRDAAERLEKKGNPCPMCNHGPLRTTDDPFFKRMVLGVKVRCSNRQKGCSWVGRLEDSEKHLNDSSVDGQCCFVKVQCPNDCGRRMQRKSLRIHKARYCTKRSVTCDYCDITTSRDEMSKHEKECDKYPELCPNKCSDDAMERHSLKRHLEEDCPLKVVECEFSYAGCPVKVKRSEMQVHVDESTQRHCSVLAKHCKCMTEEVHSLRKVACPVSSPVYTLEKFEQYKTTSRTWWSSSFYTHVGGYQMCLRIDASGLDDAEGTHVSIYVHMMSGEFDSHLQWPFKGEVCVQLINQKEGGQHLERTLVDETCSAMEDYNSIFSKMDVHTARDGWGISRFISHADLYKPTEGKEYLKNDTLKLRVTKMIATSG